MSPSGNVNPKMIEVCAEKFFEDEGVNWRFCMDYATFTHKDACEFIISIPDEDEYFELNLTHMKEQGCTEDFINALRRVRKQGAKYVLFYA